MRKKKPTPPCQTSRPTLDSPCQRWSSRTGKVQPAVIAIIIGAVLLVAFLYFRYGMTPPVAPEVPPVVSTPIAPVATPPPPAPLPEAPQPPPPVPSAPEPARTPEPPTQTLNAPKGQKGSGESDATDSRAIHHGAKGAHQHHRKGGSKGHLGGQDAGDSDAQIAVTTGKLKGSPSGNQHGKQKGDSSLKGAGGDATLVPRSNMAATPHAHGNTKGITNSFDGVAGSDSSQAHGGKSSGQDTTASSAAADAAAHCTTLTFKHKALASHMDGEACLHHKNLLTLGANRGDVDPRGVCIRVNGTPVHFRSWARAANSFLIGPGAGPQAEVSVQYCGANASCKESCQVPKDEFLAAIGGEGSSENDLSLTGDALQESTQHWTSNKDGKIATRSATASKNLETQLGLFDQESKSDRPQLNIFMDWLKTSEVDSCRGKINPRR